MLTIRAMFAYVFCHVFVTSLITLDKPLKNHTHDLHVLLTLYLLRLTGCDDPKNVSVTTDMNETCATRASDDHQITTSAFVGLSLTSSTSYLKEVKTTLWGHLFQLTAWELLQNQIGNWKHLWPVSQRYFGVVWRTFHSFTVWTLNFPGKISSKL